MSKDVRDEMHKMETEGAKHETWQMAKNHNLGRVLIAILVVVIIAAVLFL